MRWSSFCRIFGFSFGSEVLPHADEPAFDTKVTVYARRGRSKEDLQDHALDVEISLTSNGHL